MQKILLYYKFTPVTDPQLMKLLQDARHLIDTKKSAAAIQKCDAVINAVAD